MDIQNTVTQFDTNELHSDSEICLNSDGLPNLHADGVDCSVAKAHSDDSDKNDDKGIEGSSVTEGKGVSDAKISFRSSGNDLEKLDIFRHEDIPKLMEYISMYWADFWKADNIIDNLVSYFILSCVDGEGLHGRSLQGMGRVSVTLEK